METCIQFFMFYILQSCICSKDLPSINQSMYLNFSTLHTCTYVYRKHQFMNHINGATLYIEMSMDQHTQTD